MTGLMSVRLQTAGKEKNTSALMSSFSLIFHSMGEPFQIFVVPLLKLIKFCVLISRSHFA